MRNTQKERKHFILKKKETQKEPSIFRQEMQRDWNTFKRLKGTKKLGFLWDYYKLPVTILVTLVVVVCIFASMLWEGQKPRRLQVYAVLNTEDTCVYWFRQFEKELKSDGKPGKIELNEDQPFDYDSSYYYLYEIEVMTTVSSGRMDVAICNADMYEYLLAINACMSLDKALPEDLYTDLYDRGMIDSSTANLQMDENGEIDESQAIDGFYAVNLDGTEFEERYNQTDDGEEAPLYAVIISNTEHLDDSISFIRTLTQETILEQ